MREPIQDDVRLAERLEELNYAGDDAGAISLLEEAVALPDARDRLDLSSWYEELAWQYSNSERFDDAISAMQAAIDSGLESIPDARAFVAEFLMKSGRVEEARTLFERVRQDTPDDPWLYNAAAHTFGDVGEIVAALDWSTQGMRLALDAEDTEALEPLHVVRASAFYALERRPDDLQRQAVDFLDTQHREDVWADEAMDSLDESDVQGTQVAIGWLPESEFRPAVRRWPSFAEAWDGDSYSEYCRSLEKTIRDLRAAGLEASWLSPIELDMFEKWCAEAGTEVDTSEARARYAATVLRTGGAVRWPPGRNEPCWCGSGRKYKRCCGRPFPASLLGVD